MNFKLTDEHEMIRKMVRDFAKNKVEPTAAKGMRNSTLIVRFSIRWLSLD